MSLDLSRDGDDLEPQAAEYMPVHPERYDFVKSPDICPDDTRDFQRKESK